MARKTKNSTVKVVIEMDSMWIFWPVDREIGAGEDATMEISKELFDSYTKVQAEFNKLNEQIEQLYRIQTGKQPWANTNVEVPKHEIIKGK